MKARMPKRRWSSGRGALTVIALMLFGSGLVRGWEPGMAIALELKDQMLQESEAETPSEVPAGPDVAALAPELIALLEETQARARALDEREAALEARLQSLALVEAAVGEELAKLERAEAELRATMALADTAAETDLGQLTSVYENMKPEQAAALFQRMEPSFAAGFLSRMRADSAAAILSGLEPDLAYTISVVLAGRNANVPREKIPEAETADK